MPFSVLETHSRHNQPATATVSYSHATEKSQRRGGKPRLTISIPTTICGTTKADAFELLIGDGEDQGKIRISGLAKKSDAKGGIEPSQHAHFFRWNFGFVPRLGEEDTFEGEKRPVKKISDDIFEIDVPASWFGSKED
jgi:hypothetical protein